MNSAINTLNHIYKESISLILEELKDIDNHSLFVIVDPVTNDPDTKSIQTVLNHIINSGNGYINYIQTHLNISILIVNKQNLTNISEIRNGLNDLLENYDKLFKNLTDIMLEKTDIAKKITTNWGQQFDLEQLIEHSIVHNLRHLYQLKKYKKLVSNN